ncbi:hypothetical protein CMV_026983 [Castanea mollissima]|uniref:Cysteine proteinase inhibitor n=1 Tax=Castanea mollissima TaxID=60419 RepID=A0A8J4QAB1_9ROSI|nr:hypothetical protein CMV_026983 [Castanea mollissima]
MSLVLHKKETLWPDGKETPYNTLLQFKKVVNAKQQVVSGTIYILTLEVEDGGKKKVYEAKIWEKPWLNFKEVQEFKLIGDAPTHHSA